MPDSQKRSDEQMRHETSFNTQTSQGETSEVEGALPPEAQGLIGHQLRQEYRRLLSEPLPDKFTRLLEELADSEGKSGSKE